MYCQALDCTLRLSLTTIPVEHWRLLPPGAAPPTADLCDPSRADPFLRIFHSQICQQAVSELSMKRATHYLT